LQGKKYKEGRERLRKVYILKWGQKVNQGYADSSKDLKQSNKGIKDLQRPGKKKLSEGVMEIPLQI